MEPDLKLILDGDTEGSHVEIMVWHQVMWNASPYFQRLLQPGRFAEGNDLMRDGKAEISLPETNAQAMQVICHVFHLRVDEVLATEMTSDLLFDVAVLADKFDCVKSLWPWPSRWMEQHHIRKELKMTHQDLEHMTARGLSRWICIGQILGCVDRLDLLILALTNHHVVDNLEKEANDCIDYLTPSLIDQMRARRIEVVTGFHTIMLECAELVERGDSCRLGASHPLEYPNYDNIGDGTPDDRFHCSSVTMGNFLLAARAKLGENWRSLDSWTGSITTTHRQMRQVGRYLTGPSHIASSPSSKKYRALHEGCSLEDMFAARVESVMETPHEQARPHATEPVAM